MLPQAPLFRSVTGLEGLSYCRRERTIRLSEAAGSALSLCDRLVANALRGLVRQGWTIKLSEASGSTLSLVARLRGLRLSGSQRWLCTKSWTIRLSETSSSSFSPVFGLNLGFK